MKICGIISEFDPFHNGHRYLIDSVRAEGGADAVVCVMSGDFTQRGAPAVTGKFARAEAAVRGGADLVLELPFCYASNGATEFAKGGVRILRGLGCVDMIAFGSESGDAEELKKAARLLAEEPDAFREKLRKGLNSGLSYPESYSLAASSMGVRLFDGGSPNDLLAAEYLKQCVLQGFGPEIFCVKRTGAAHREGASVLKPEDYDRYEQFQSVSVPVGRPAFIGIDTDRHILSGSGIRDLIAKAGSREEALNKIAGFIPENSLGALRNSDLWDAACEERLFTLLRHTLMTKSSEELSAAAEAGEGIENRLRKSLQSASDTDSLILGAKTRRYTYSRISRMLMQLLAGLTKERYAVIDGEDTAYARILAFSDTGAAVLSLMKDTASIPVYTNLNKRRPEKEGEKLSLETDVLAADIYSNLMGGRIYDGSDLTCNPVIVRI